MAAVENIIVFKKADIPDALHYKNNVRIGDLVIIAKLGYTIVVDKELEVDWKNHRKSNIIIQNFWDESSSNE